MLAIYASTAGSAGSVIRKWPKQSGLIRSENGRTLVMAIHPRCSCTRASLEKLGRVVRGANGLRSYVLVLAPAAEAARWYQTDLYRTASALPGVQVFADRNGREAARFGIDTSGHVLLYSASGDLEFSGGVTGGRGEAGDNPGQSALVSLTREGSTGRRSFPVFGCSLFGSRATL